MIDLKPTDLRPKHFTPLRYPGGKGKLAQYVKSIIVENDLADGEYVEPYAGGAAIALELLLHEYVSKIHINDISVPVFSFWKSVLTQTDELCRLVHDTPLTVRSWDRQKKIFSNPREADTLQLGFAMFFLNRTNRSGILNGGIIGGRDQRGKWKIDARYNAQGLIKRIEAIANLASRVSLSRKDALTFLKTGADKWTDKTLIYCDPPYYVKGRELYYNFYEHGDHADVANFVTKKISRQRWVVSYDNVKPIRELYPETKNIVYKIGYSAREAGTGTEIMFFSNNLEPPRLIGPVSLVRTTYPRPKKIKRPAKRPVTTSLCGARKKKRAVLKRRTEK